MLDFCEICDPERDETIPFINRIPKLKAPLNFKPHYIYETNDAKIIYIPDDNEDAKKLLDAKDFTMLENKYQLYAVNERHMETLLNSIIGTTGRYVYPMIFVNFIKSSLDIKTKIIIPEEHLLKYRVWSNQIRELSHESKAKRSPVFNPKIKELGYQLCCELLHTYVSSTFMLSTAWPELSTC